MMSLCLPSRQEVIAQDKLRSINTVTDEDGCRFSAMMARSLVPDYSTATFYESALFDVFTNNVSGMESSSGQWRAKKLAQDFQNPFTYITNHTGVVLWLKDMSGRVFRIANDSLNDPSAQNGAVMSHDILVPKNLYPNPSLGDRPDDKYTLVVHEVLNPFTMDTKNNPVETITCPEEVVGGTIYDDFKKRAMFAHRDRYNGTNGNNDCRVSTIARFYTRERLLESKNRGGVILHNTPFMVFTSRAEAYRTPHWIEQSFKETTRPLVNHAGYDIAVFGNPDTEKSLFSNINEYVIEIPVTVRPMGVTADVQITIINGSSKEPAIEFVTLEQMLSVGFNGVRLHRSREEAINDLNRPLSPEQISKHTQRVARAESEMAKAENDFNTKIERQANELARLQLETERAKKELDLVKDRLKEEQSLLVLETERARREVRYNRAKETTSFLTKSVDFLKSTVGLVTTVVTLTAAVVTWMRSRK